MFLFLPSPKYIARSVPCRCRLQQLTIEEAAAYLKKTPKSFEKVVAGERFPRTT
jgi:hypothetical protein